MIEARLDSSVFGVLQRSSLRERLSGPICGGVAIRLWPVHVVVLTYGFQCIVCLGDYGVSAGGVPGLVVACWGALLQREQLGEFGIHGVDGGCLCCDLRVLFFDAAFELHIFRA